MLKIFQRILFGLLVVGTNAQAEGVPVTPEHKSFLEGVWSGVSADTSADKLCSKVAPPPGALALAIEFERSGGLLVASDGSEDSIRGPITDASEANGVISLTVGQEVFRLRPDSDKIMSRVRSSASLGGDVDTMVFKRCETPTDRSAIAIDDNALKYLASDMPGDEAFYIDERLVPKAGNACTMQDTQYLFFALIGPSQFRLSRWNSFALADKLAEKKPVKLPLDRVTDWKIETVRAEAGKFVFRMRDYDNAKALPETIHVEVKPSGISIPEWKRTYIRCTGFQSRY
ncbi:MAG: hypothetical protein ABL973_05365 [Micropepsaceae bacterium]